MRLIIPLLMFAALGGAVKADAPYSGYKDEPAPRVNLYQKAAAPRGWWSECGRRIELRECVRIQMKDRERQRAERRRWRDEERRYTSERLSSRNRDRDTVERNIGRCGGEISAEGKKMWRIAGIDVAKREARLQWEREVNSKLGERYADPAYARKIDGDGYTCWKAGASNRCTFTARPCRAGS